MKRLVLVLAIIAASASGACTSQACPTALLIGVLTEQAGELVVVHEGNDIGVRVIWPDGYTVGRDGETLVVTNFIGVVVARESDGVRLGGGEDPRQDAFRVCGLFEVVR